VNSVIERVLVTIDDVMALLCLDRSHIEWLANSGQLQPIQICGQERFDTQDIRRLVETYKTTQMRRKK
jgi:hypothetical protein